MEFDYDLFISQYQLYLFGGMILSLAALISFDFVSNKKISLLLLMTGALCLRLFVSLMDPFLHGWDEQFHALVAKNLLENPWKPVLVKDPILPFSYTSWPENHVWLHKQPLFLWQMAVSIKLFGVNEFAVRVPSILMSTLILAFLYRIGAIAYSKKAGFYAAFLFTGSFYMLELVSGRFATDHNDVAFLFYVTASIWAWFESTQSEKKYWFVLIGVFSGAAIMVKWLVGLLVYSGWAMSILMLKNQRRWGSYKNFGLSVLITAIVASPWQLYTAIRFPVESQWEMLLARKHFYSVIEGHDGGWLFHFTNFNEVYGVDFIYVLLFALPFFFVSGIAKRNKIAMIVWIGIVYLFFSIAATKMLAFTLIVSPLIYVIIGVGLIHSSSLLEGKISKVKNHRIITRWITVLIASFIFVHFLNHDRLRLSNQEERKSLHINEISNTLVYQNLQEEFPSPKTFFFNTPEFDHIKVLFYTSARARSGIPTPEVISQLREKKYTIVVFDNGKLPDYILQDKHITKYPLDVWKY